MLKKAGIVVAATTCSLLMLSPLALASDGHGRHHHDDDNDGGGGLINVSDLGVQVPVQLCGNDIVSGVLGVLSRGQSNDSSDDTECDQDSSIDDD